MINNLATTKIYDKFQTVIPVEVRKKYDIDGRDYFIEWNINDKGKIELDFVKKLSFEDMVGRYKAKKPIDSLELKKQFRKGEFR
ncbi:MAG: AbrB/MazE/SpoVT family DNA-binding domain-containing protein [Methanobrevibacter sp.]|jgi:bifunctional DNA-binding transcriptional regulator/antitoxin component of YhaV-PrlF toxin-antitoxin module|nr:AbrB/MazE/SpoVT family DNA-binding domain-containing protein [Candidatus Methanovirga aequatorialis]